jgi:anionic cell wall polymer biosynthesis LytR-Cps2A-Psr (LCP) family protein
MTGKKNSIDGFALRRSSASSNGLARGTAGLPAVQNRKLLSSGESIEPSAARRQLGEVRPMVQPSKAIEQTKATGGISRSEIDESLNGIDDQTPEVHRRKRRLSGAQIKRIIKWLLILIIVIGIGMAAFLGIKTMLAGGNIFKGNPFDIIQNKPLKMDANGRSNILILGTSEDDPGHEAATLTDSMMILSVDQHKKNAYMISIPRDLYVKFGKACPGGYQSKINEYFSCVGGDPKNIQATRDALTKEGKFIGDIFGLDIQYGANLNYTVMRDLVAAVGGSITINIESRDPNGQLDSNFDWKCGVNKLRRTEQIKRCPPSGHFIDYPNGPATLDAEHTLYLAQARGDRAPTYGFEQSNFDREKNQQKIIKALREKAVSAGVLTDLGKVVGVIDALGNNLRTTFETKEIGTLVSLARDIKSENIRSISLNDKEDPMMTGGNVGGASIVRPVAGLYNYGQLQAYIKKELTATAVTREKAKVTVLNGSGVAGAAQVEADKLEEQGMVIGGISNAPAGDYGKVTIYQIDKKKTASAKKLEEMYGVKLLTTAPPATVTGDTSFVVIVGTIAKPAAADE